ncbi:hypothetical protein QBC47DRAFT_175215 [Echria macrotheca]|uniref:Rhodopsin domain-containing protein n=1 Tax=Echria macrotheca TaxID=438768 RepID=A0AAJ0BHU5_9PEZI|nr:hypothetical protein QBC47DRAFT_175215 [Echria macrotheca]
MSLYSSAPPARPFSDDKPTVLVAWWIAGLCSVVIALRLAGRWIRVERLFVEDKIAAYFLIPLFLRTAVIHVVLLYGTNNVLLETPLQFTDEELRRRSVGSGLVLLTRVLHPATIWTLKFVNLEFFGRLVDGQKRYMLTLWCIRGVFVAAFVAIVISTLTECQPFPHYWVVAPDPGPQCRQGYAQLLTMAVGSSITDVLLVVFPLPIIASSKLKLGRKIILMMLFCLALLNVIISIYRVPRVLREDGYQGTRSTWASVEILVATFVANALALGSFVRDTGIKKARFKYEGSGHGSSGVRSAQRGPPTDIERGRTKIAGGVVGSRATSGETDDDSGSLHGKVLSRTQSRDSLIPRGHVAAHSLETSSAVMKTTTIHVTVSDVGENRGASGNHDLDAAGLRVAPPMVRPMERSKSASSRGRERGSTLVLQNFDPLPSSGSPSPARNSPSRGRS